MLPKALQNAKKIATKFLKMGTPPPHPFERSSKKTAPVLTYGFPYLDDDDGVLVVSWNLHIYPGACTPPGCQAACLEPWPALFPEFH